jgi:hypothetical protein
MQGEPIALTLRHDNDEKWDAAMNHHICRIGEVQHACSLCTYPMAQHSHC